MWRGRRQNGRTERRGKMRYETDNEITVTKWKQEEEGRGKSEERKKARNKL
jgi:hypothetical protein